MDRRVDSLKLRASTAAEQAHADIAQSLKDIVLNLVNNHYTAAFIIDNKNYMDIPEYHIQKIWKTTMAKDLHLKLKQYVNDKIIDPAHINVLVKQW
jgi:hypothetical protein